MKTHPENQRRKPTLKTLVVLPNWIGDAVIAQSLLQLLNQQGHLIDVLAHPPISDLAQFFPEVRHVLTPPFDRKKLNFFQRWRYAKSLQNQYDQTFVLPNSFKSALLPAMANIPHRSGYKGEMRYGLLTHIFHDTPFTARCDQRLNQILGRSSTLTNRDPVISQYLTRRPMSVFYAALAQEKNEAMPALASIPLPKINAPQDISSNLRAEINKLLKATSEEDPLNNHSFAVICPGAEFGAAKRWPPSYFAELIHQQLGEPISDGKTALRATTRVRTILLVGSDKDRLTGQEIHQQLSTEHQSSVLNLCGKTSIADAIWLLHFARWVVANDSGLMHIAAAVGAPVLGIYGPTDFWHTPPRGSDAYTIAYETPCAPCQLRQCPLKGDSFHQCMQQLSPQLVQQHPIFLPHSQP